MGVASLLLYSHGPIGLVWLTISLWSAVISRLLY